MIEKLDRAWRRMFPRRNPKIWSDETLVVTSVMQDELKKLDTRLKSLEDNRNRVNAA